MKRTEESCVEDKIKKAKLKEGKDEGHLSLLHGDSCVGDPKTVMMMKVF